MQNSEWLKPALLGDVEQSREDPDATITLASLMGGEQLMDTGGATMAGATEADRNVAKACMEALAAQF